MIKNNLYNLLTLAAFIAMQSMPAVATPLDKLIEGAKLCTRHLQHYETEYGIPAHLLSAIASTESGRYHKGLKLNLPWPWTINADGKGYFFDSKEDAIEGANKLYARGIKSMDVGCMQINLYHHPDAFTSLSQAFEPEDNIAYAASFLRNLYRDEGTWKKAASDYHSKTPQLGSKYIGLVYNSWFRIVDKLRTARLSTSNSSVNALNEMQQADITAPTAPTTPAPKYISVTKLDDKESSPYKSPHMKTIKVRYQGESTKKSEARRRDNGLIIVRPEITVVDNEIIASNKESAPEPMIMADSTQVNVNQSILDAAPSAGRELQQSPSAPEAKIIRLDNKLVDKRPANTQTIKKSGPNFIFSN